MKLFVIALFVLLVNAGVVGQSRAAGVQPKERQVLVDGKKVDYSLVNLETKCAANRWRDCYTELSPKAKQK